MNRSRYLGALAALALAAGGVTAQGLAAQGATAGSDEISAIDPIAPVHDIPDSVDTTLVNETKGSWFVELESEPASSGTDAKTLTAERQDFRAAPRTRESTTRSGARSTPCSTATPSTWTRPSSGGYSAPRASRRSTP